ncbi:hypothetical protein O181_015068 [Austropuccinia psidii MF-1]|uniref:Uncharacterized protein n=1 Tax=Austropuccinia psidii MF-1 TaxID=1389203 RepID=A0A9Q3C1R8_9BASI|nr:hypothetical protein [Austropuccinia psidii MF-1]
MPKSPFAPEDSSQEPEHLIHGYLHSSTGSVIGIATPFSCDGALEAQVYNTKTMHLINLHQKTNLVEKLRYKLPTGRLSHFSILYSTQTKENIFATPKICSLSKKSLVVVKAQAPEPRDLATAPVTRGATGTRERLRSREERIRQASRVVLPPPSPPPPPPLPPAAPLAAIPPSAAPLHRKMKTINLSFNFQGGLACPFPESPPKALALSNGVKEPIPSDADGSVLGVDPHPTRPIIKIESDIIL